MWHWHAGAPLALFVGDAEHRLGADIAAGERPQVVVPADTWQSAETLGEFTLVGCTVAPPFDFEHFELAPPGVDPR